MVVLVAYFLALIVSFYLLAQVSDKYFVVSLDKIAERLNMSHDMAGATLMAIGSSAPELFVALISVFRSGGEHKEIGIGTIVGSALFNILVIIGASAMVRKAVLVWQPVLRDLLFYIIAIITLFIVFYDGNITILESFTLMSIYVLYLLAVRYWRKLFKFTEIDVIDNEEEHDEEHVGFMKIFFPFDYALSKFYLSSKHYYLNFLISIAMIALLSWVLVESAINISMILEVPEVIIALTVLAVGTSIPDLMSSVIVARQGRGGMAVSNAIGSNIFDILIGLGLPWALVLIFTNTDLQNNKEGLSESIILLFGSVIFIFAILAIGRWKMSKMTGIFLIGLYMLYLVYSGVNML
ncbi:MAG: calcium/sodium antiporter [Cyclobacteriaceae bacterium]|nr:calcium/sodium antiporter [Cyclobacteriaceae bacterium]